MVQAAVEMDRILLSMVQKATGLVIPMVDQGIGVRALPLTPSNQSSRKIVSELDDENTSKEWDWDQ